MNTEALRAFVLVAEHGRFAAAADELAITQQAVSKRVAALEGLLGVALFARRSGGTDLTVDGRAFLPHARAVLVAVQDALESVRPASRALRVDVLGRRLAPADLVLDFHRTHPDLDIDMLALGGGRQAMDALANGSIDVAFCYVPDPDAVPRVVAHARVYDEPLDLLVGPGHPLASGRGVRLADLRGERVWVPGIVAGSEWGSFYAAMAAEFAIDVDPTGPDFGLEHLLDTIADSPTLATFVGARSRIAWPARYELTRVPIRDPTPVYPWSILWRTGNHHTGLDALRDHLRRLRPDSSGTWTPAGLGATRT